MTTMTTKQQQQWGEVGGIGGGGGGGGGKDASAIKAYCCTARITLGSEIVLTL
jgi:hypothetical protein